MQKRMSKQELLSLIETLEISPEEFWVLSSSSLVLRDLFDSAGDLDLAVTEKGLEQLKKQFNLKQKDNGWYIVNERIECVLDTKEAKYNLESLEKYFEYLKNSTREKDIIKYNIVKEKLEQKMNNKVITVVAALIKKDNQVLIAKRATGDSNVYGKWEFPGGKVEKDETEENAIEREIFEEFEMKIKSKKFLINNLCEYPTRTIDLRLYECEYISGDFKLHDHLDYAWIDIKDLLNYDLAKADIPLAEYLIRNEK